MFSLFKSHTTNEKEVYQELKEFYDSFFSDIYNEMNIDRYRQIRDVIGLVINKFDENDHPLEYTSKLVMYIQARVATCCLTSWWQMASCLSRIFMRWRPIPVQPMTSPM